MKNLLFTLNNAHFISAAVLLVFASIALYQDIRYMKIYNKLNLAMAVSGIIFSFLTGNIVSSVEGLFLPLVLLPLFALKMLGAGDIKFFCAAGAWLGFPLIISFTAVSIMANAVVAVIFMLSRKNGAKLFKEFFTWLKICFLTRKLSEYALVGKEHDVFPYMIGIFISSVITFIIQIH